MTKQDVKHMDVEKQGAVPVHKSIAAALAMAQGEMGKALKSANNPHFKSKYADLSSVVDACMPSLTRHGIAVIQPTFDDDSGRYVKTILIHGESGETLECRVPLIVQKNDMQGYGSAVTYARRYGLMGMAGIAPDDDDGNAASKAAPLVGGRSDTKEFDAVGVRDRIKEAVAAAVDIAALDRLWVHPKTVDALGRLHPAMKGELTKAHDERRAELTPSDSSTSEMLDDEIPY